MITISTRLRWTTFTIIFACCGVIAWSPYAMGTTKLHWAIISHLAGPLAYLLITRNQDRRADR